jgi:hypothetical protein
MNSAKDISEIEHSEQGKNPEDLTVNEIKEHKRVLEETITKNLQEFQQKTGICVERIEIENQYFDLRRIGSVSSVEIKLESL